MKILIVLLSFVSLQAQANSNVTWLTNFTGDLKARGSLMKLIERLRKSELVQIVQHTEVPGYNSCAIIERGRDAEVGMLISSTHIKIDAATGLPLSMHSTPVVLQSFGRPDSYIKQRIFETIQYSADQSKVASIEVSAQVIGAGGDMHGPRTKLYTCVYQ